MTQPMWSSGTGSTLLHIATRDMCHIDAHFAHTCTAHCKMYALSGTSAPVHTWPPQEAQPTVLHHRAHSWRYASSSVTMSQPDAFGCHQPGNEHITAVLFLSFGPARAPCQVHKELLHTAWCCSCCPSCSQGRYKAAFSCSNTERPQTAAPDKEPWGASIGYSQAIIAPIPLVSLTRSPPACRSMRAIHCQLSERCPLYLERWRLRLRLSRLILFFFHCSTGSKSETRSGYSLKDRCSSRQRGNRSACPQDLGLLGSPTQVQYPAASDHSRPVKAGDGAHLGSHLVLPCSTSNESESQS